MTEVGARVFALRDADDDTVYLYGFGVYAGKHMPPGQEVTDEDLVDARRAIAATDEDGYRQRQNAWWVELIDRAVAEGRMTAEEGDLELVAMVGRSDVEAARPLEERAAELAATFRSNPRIDLDGGGVVWGYQCWWGPIEKWDDLAAGREVVAVPVPQ